MNPDNSRASAGARPKVSANISRASSVRMPAFTSAGTGQSRGRPSRLFHASYRAASRSRHEFGSS